MNHIQLPPLNSLLAARVEPTLMKETYKKVHIYLFDFDLVLGKGSFSKVYKGVNLNTNEQVAVKVIEMGSVNTPKLRQLLLQQIDILMKIKHQNLIKCVQVLSSSKNTYIVMELCTYDFASVCEYVQKQQQVKEQQAFMLDNNSKFFSPNETAYSSSKHTKQSSLNSPKINTQLQKQISNLLSNSFRSISSTKSIEFNNSFNEQNGIFSDHKKNALKEEKFYPYIKQIFSGLQYLHKLNIVHRDLKLSNIFLNTNKACKIGDFGFATMIPSNQSSIRDTCCIGSPLYMSPQSYLENIYSLKSDIWSFGVLIFEMIYGNPPLWNCPTHDALKQEIKIPINMRKFQKIAVISQDLKQVIEGCLQVDISKRFSVDDLKQTKLFKRLFYQPLQSDVISNIKENKGIEESNVVVFERTLQRNDSVRPFDIEQFRLNNLCGNQNQNTLQKDREFLTKGINNIKSQSQRKAQRSHTINPLQNTSTIFDQLTNNSFTERFNNGSEIRRRQQSTPYKNETASKISSFQQKFRPLDMNSPAIKQRNLSPAVSYKNSQGMQKYLKQMSEKNKLKENRNDKFEFKNYDHNPVTFSDLQKLLGSPKANKDPSPVYSQEKQSPRFVSPANESFIYSPKYKNSQESLLNRNFSKIEENPKNDKQNQDLMNKNYSMLETKSKSPKNFTPTSPRNNQMGYNYYFKKQEKQNRKEQGLLNKNYSAVNFAPVTKRFSIAKQPTAKYEYKSKLLQKCTSSPKFETMNDDLASKQNKSTEKYSKYISSSTYFGNGTPSVSKLDKDRPFIAKQSNQKQVNKRPESYSKGCENTNNLLTQFTSKINEHPSQIQKKTYWKGANHKNFTLNLGDKTEQQDSSNTKKNVNTSRNNSILFDATSNEDDKNLNKKSHFTKETGLEAGFMMQAFRLLNGELIIKDACQLVHFTRLLHKLSFTTESNSSSILLLQYSVQILSNLLEKCENFEVKYHYDSSTGKANQVRQAFKANQYSLSNLIQVNEKECYAIKKDISSSINQSNTPCCNKTLQLKTIILSYIRKFTQRKQALVKLFECNALFQNLTNKAKDLSNKSINRNQNKLIAIRRTSFLQKGFLNFTKLQKTLQQIDSQIISKKQNTREMFTQMVNKQQSISARTLISVALVCIDTISRCVHEKSFFNFIPSFKDNLKNAARNDFELFKSVNKNDEQTGKSLIQRLIEGFTMDLKNASKNSIDSHQQKDSLFNKNFSALVSRKDRF